MELWYPKAIIRRGPGGKVLGESPINLIVAHSAEGSYAGLLYELDRTDRRAAWHFSARKDGVVVQHYPINAVLGHSADWNSPGDNDPVNGNGEGVGIEFEGRVGEPLTEAQVKAAIDLFAWIAKEGDFVLSRDIKHRTAWEHREISDTGTNCPSGRIPWDKILVESTLPPPAKVSDFYDFWHNKPKPHRVRRQNPTTLAYEYVVTKYVKG